MRLLEVLESEGGKLSIAGLARRLNVATFRLSGFLAQAQRLLNIDGYAILSFDSEAQSIEYNRDLLFRQFKIKDPRGTDR